MQKTEDICPLVVAPLTSGCLSMTVLSLDTEDNFCAPSGNRLTQIRFSRSGPVFLWGRDLSPRAIVETKPTKVAGIKSEYCKGHAQIVKPRPVGKLKLAVSTTELLVSILRKPLLTLLSSSNATQISLSFSFPSYLFFHLFQIIAGSVPRMASLDQAKLWCKYQLTRGHAR